MKAFSHNPSPNLDLEGRTPTISDAVKDNSPLRSQSTEPQRPQVNYSQLRTMTVPPNSDVAAMRAAINAFLGDREVNMANQKADQDGSG